MEDVMVGATIQLALFYVIVMDDLGLNWAKMDGLVWVRAHNYYACTVSLYYVFCILYFVGEWKILKCRN